MNAIDNLSSEVMVRARYLDNVEKRHMSTEAALLEADRWAAGLIGDRARGAKAGYHGVQVAAHQGVHHVPAGGL